MNKGGTAARGRPADLEEETALPVTRQRAREGKLSLLFQRWLLRSCALFWVREPEDVIAEVADTEQQRNASMRD